MRKALLIVIVILAVTVAFRRRGASSPLRLTRPRAKGAGGGPTRITWAERKQGFRLASQLITALILLWMTVEIALWMFD